MVTSFSRLIRQVQLSVVTCAIVAGSQRAQSQDTFEWTSAVGGLYSDPARWTLVSGAGPAPPSVGDSVRLNEPGTYAIECSFASAGDILMTAGDVRLDGNGGSSNLFLSSGAADFTVSGGSLLRVGYNESLNLFVNDQLGIAGGGQLTLGFGSLISTSNLSVGGLGSGTVQIASDLVVNNSTFIGDGVLQIRNGIGTLSGTTNVGVSSIPGTLGTLLLKRDTDATIDDLHIGGGSAATSAGEVLLETEDFISPTLTVTPGSVVTIGGAAGTGTGLLDGGTIALGGPVFVNPTGTLNGSCTFGDDVTVDGGVLNVVPTISPDITMSLSNDAVWDLSIFFPDLDLGQNATLALSTGADFSANDIEIGLANGESGTLTADGSGTSVVQFVGDNDEPALLTVGSAFGPLSLLQIANQATWETGTDPVTIGTTGEIEVTGGGVLNIHGDVEVNGVLDATGGAINLDSGLPFKVQGSGSANLPASFDYSLFGGQQWEVLGNSALTLPGELILMPGGELVIDGGSATFGTLDVDGGQLSFETGLLEVLDDLYLDTDETLTAGKTLTIVGAATIFGPNELVIDGGSYNGGALNLFPGATLDLVSGSASASGPVLALGGSSLILRTGSTALGDASQFNGFYCNGLLDILDNELLINDANDAVFDSAALVMMGVSGGDPGLLTALNGLTNDFGANVYGYGTVDTPDDSTTPFINNGHIAGFGSQERIELTGFVKGVGTFDYVDFLGTFSPGFSPAAINLGSATFKGTLKVEIGGATPGSGHDQLNHALGEGVATLGGELELVLTSGFVPATGSEFTILTANVIEGEFDSKSGPVNLRVEYRESEVIVRVVCAADTDENGVVNVTDLLAVLANWGACNGCAADTNLDGVVNVTDLLNVLAAWGACS